jgi:hypothetical protein
LIQLLRSTQFQLVFLNTLLREGNNDYQRWSKFCMRKILTLWHFSSIQHEIFTLFIDVS